MIGRTNAINPTSGEGNPEETKTVAVNFSNGDQSVFPTEGFTLAKVILQKPETLSAMNIKKDVVIAGVRGIYEGISEETQPRLNALTIAHSGSATLSITNPTTNGNFVVGYKIYTNDELLIEQTGTSYTLTLLPNGEYEVVVKCKGNNFLDSLDSNALSVGVFELTYILKGLTSTTSTKRITNTQTMSFTLKPDSGKYLPEFIDVYCNGQTVKYTYNSYTGVVSISALPVKYESPTPDGSQLPSPTITLVEECIEVSFVPNAENIVICFNDEDVHSIETSIDDKFLITIEATAYDEQKLRTPVIVLERDILTIEDLTYAEFFELYINETLNQTIGA